MTTRIPPEVWDRIFEIATHVPYIFIPEIFDKSTFIGSRKYDVIYLPAFADAFATKRNLVLVCKQWWHLAIRYLYGALLIRDTRKLLSICSTLQSYANGKGAVPGAKPLGWWTERLDVEIRGSAADGERLVDVIMCLPNLAIVHLDFRISLSIFLYEPIMRSIPNALRHAASTLRVLDWSTRLLDPATLLGLQELLAELPQLCILCCQYMPWMDGVIPQNILSSITTFAVKEMFITEGGIPGECRLGDRRVNLREVIIDAGWYGLESWSRFMCLYGTFLSSVHLTMSGFSSEALFHHLAIIKQSCPNIRRLTLSLTDFSYLTRETLTLPPIEYLGVNMVEACHSKMEPESLFSALAIFKDTVPTLRVVQLTHPDNVDRLLTVYQEVAIGALETDLAECPFRIEDHDGNLLLERLKAVVEPFCYIKYLFQSADAFD